MPSTLWSADDVLVAALPFVVGIVAWAIAWYQVAGQVSYGHQIGWGDLAVGGLILTTTGQLLWLLRGRRAVGEARRRLLRLEASGLPRSTPPATRNEASPEDDDRVAGPNARFFHRRDCPMVVDRNWAACGRLDHLASGRTPCGVCKP
jgi:hypothetical protein